MTRIVRTHYRCERPPRKRAKAAPLEGRPVIVTATSKPRRHDTSDEAKLADPLDITPEKLQRGSSNSAKQAANHSMEPPNG